MKNCLVCDDHALLREALVGMVLQAWPEADVVEAGNFPQAWEAAKDRPDFCLVDLRMPGAEPLDGIQKLRDIAPTMPVMVVTGTASDREMLELLDLGVAGFMDKTTGGAVLVAAIRLILAGGRYVPERLAEIMPASRSNSDPAEVRLTARQKEVIALVARGCSNKEVARLLGIAPSSVKTHLTAVQELLGTANRAESAVQARALGLI